ncbi:MAG: ribosomal protein S18-alanine N-acetyltransferase [Gemmatimonadaceae bacterium]
MIGAAWRPAGVRHAVGTDLELVGAIERVSFSDPWSVEALASALALPHARFFVAEDVEAGRVGRGGAPLLLGYVVALLYGEDGEIADLAVAPAARRRGIGGMLLDRVVETAMESGARALYLEVRESNVAARALYASRGFDLVGRRRGYYQRPAEDALVLRRSLAPA